MITTIPTQPVMRSTRQPMLQVSQPELVPGVGTEPIVSVLVEEAPVLIMGE